MENKTPKQYTVLDGKQTARQVADFAEPNKPVQENYGGHISAYHIDLYHYESNMAIYREHIASLPVIQLPAELLKKWQAEAEDTYKVYPIYGKIEEHGTKITLQRAAYISACRERWKELEANAKLIADLKTEIELYQAAVELKGNRVKELEEGLRELSREFKLQGYFGGAIAKADQLLNK